MITYIDRPVSKFLGKAHETRELIKILKTRIYEFENFQNQILG